MLPYQAHYAIDNQVIHCLVNGCRFSQIETELIRQELRLSAIWQAKIPGVWEAHFQDTVKEYFVNNVFCPLHKLTLFPSGEPTETDQRHKFVGLCGLYVLYIKLYQTNDKKLFKQFWDSYRRVRI